jgi:hypothetical protein
VCVARNEQSAAGKEEHRAEKRLAHIRWKFDLDIPMVYLIRYIVLIAFCQGLRAVERHVCRARAVLRIKLTRECASYIELPGLWMVTDRSLTAMTARVKGDMVMVWELQLASNGC